MRQRARTYFASGSNRVGDIAGLSDISHPIGVAAPDMSEAAIVELLKVDVPVFVDSGAFEEFMCNRPISSDEWERRLALYARLARGLGSSVYVVAPDKIADQKGTLARLDRYLETIKDIESLGANILMPIQNGELSLVDFDAACRARLGDAMIPALPMKAAATSREDAIAYVEAVKPRRLHLLGLGPESSRFDVEDFLAELETIVPGIELFLDSCLIRRMVRRTNGPKNGPRALTEAQDWVATEINEWTHYGAPAGSLGWDAGSDWTEVLFDADSWLRGKARVAIAEKLEAVGMDETGRLFRRSPSAAIADETVEALLYDDLRAAWAEYFNGKASAPERKRRAIGYVVEAYA